ncbi:Plscr3 [Symbiodinium natans]|uniref:Phospholipid scramblase n=1 Tax=Symbiodinium natans TaxID=878477 RepID=A0A812T0T4_9DINO|nr:Plscr3 [Symbiodinium natans]
MGLQTVGSIRRQFNTQQALGLVTGVNADSDQFHVDFKEVQSPEWKAALIAMALFLDYCYFVKGGQSARRESALGRAAQIERRWENDR